MCECVCICLCVSTCHSLLPVVEVNNFLPRCGGEGEGREEGKKRKGKGSEEKEIKEGKRKEGRKK